MPRLGRALIQGFSSDCTDAGIDCGPATVACCFADGCLDLPSTECRTAGGDSQGFGSTCAVDGCPASTVACCFSDGTCEDLGPAACLNQGGVSQRTGSVCATANCE